MSTAATAAAGAAGMVANAIKASGAIVQVNVDEFHSLLNRAEGALVVHAEGGMFSKNYQYLLSYKGFVFFTKSPRRLQLPSHIDQMRAEKIWIPV